MQYDLKITSLLLFGFDLQIYNFLLRLQRSFLRDNCEEFPSYFNYDQCTQLNASTPDKDLYSPGDYRRRRKN